MIKIVLFFFIIIIFSSQKSFAINIAVLDIEEIINNNEQYKTIIKQIEVDQKNESKFLENIESKLKDQIEEIESSKLLLDQNEINKLINQYNDNLVLFNKTVDNFNQHYQNEITNIRNKILNEVIILTEKYAKNKNIELILDSTNYIIASNNINITDRIKDMVNNTKLKLEFKSFENN